MQKTREKCDRGEDSIAVLGDPALKQSIYHMDDSTSKFLNQILSEVHFKKSKTEALKQMTTQLQALEKKLKAMVALKLGGKAMIDGSIDEEEEESHSFESVDLDEDEWLTGKINVSNKQKAYPDQVATNSAQQKQ